MDPRSNRRTEKLRGRNESGGESRVGEPSGIMKAGYRCRGATEGH